MRNSADSGSAAIELVALSVLLVLPLGFYANAVQQISEQLLAEQIARHAIRSLVLSSQPQSLVLARQQAREISTSWGSNRESQISLNCQATCQPGDLLTISVGVGQATAIQTMAIQK